MLVPVHGCGSAFDVLLAAGSVGYRCDNAGNDYTVDDSLRLGTTEVVRTHGEEFTGSFLGGLVADGGTLAFDVASAGNKIRGEFLIHQTRVWKATGSRKAIVRTFRGEATVASLNTGRIAVLRGGGKAVSVLASAGGIQTFGFGGQRVLGAALAGPRLVVLQAARLTVLDLRSGRRAASWPVRRGFGPAPELQGAQGNLAAYVVGASIHVLRSTTAERSSSTPRMRQNRSSRDSSRADSSTPSTWLTRGGPGASSSWRDRSSSAHSIREPQRADLPDHCRAAGRCSDRRLRTASGPAGRGSQGGCTSAR